MEYYVLKQGLHQGPFTETELVAQLSSGQFSPEDFGQPDGARHWTRLRQLFDDNEPLNGSSDHSTLMYETSEVGAPAFPSSFAMARHQWWQETSGSVQRLFRQYPLETGIMSFLLGCALLLLSYVPIFIVGPVLVAALFGGGLAMFRGRVMAGLGLCAAAVFVPALIWSAFFWAGHLLALVRA
ncbi:hypothetical protein ACXR0O_24295 [Verrucomicrobiota bacterium sgz303538]